MTSSFSKIYYIYFKDNAAYFKWYNRWKYRVDIFKVYNSRGKVVVLYHKVMG